MKKHLLFISLLASSLFIIQAQTIAFPGAEGFGRFAKGARAAGIPSIYHVTTLNDSGTGSLRDAISQPNRIVVFDVGGVIKLSSRLIFSQNLTIAGQTAPGDGVTVYGNGVTFSAANDIIVRYMRFRMGSGGESGKDAAGIANGSNMIFDHVSVSWGLDENFSINWDGKGSEPNNITIQKSIIGQGLMVHSAGGLIQTTGGVTIYKNLYIDNKTRNPKVKGLNQFSNNIVYNWGSGGGYILGGDSEGPSWGVIEDNYFIKGPSTGGTDAITRGNSNFQAYNKENILDYNVDGVLGGSIAPDSVLGSVTIVNSYNSFSNSPGTHPTLSNVLSPAAAYNWVIDSVGACIPARDEVDKYMINELKSLGTTGALINAEADLGLPGGVGYVFSAIKQVDTDNDGMPDSWEDANGLNKNLASDALLSNADGYLNIEKYINGITSGPAFVKYPNLVAVKAIGTDFITLKWANNASAATSIVLEQSTDNINFNEIIRLDPSLSEYKISGLSQVTTYYYRLKTINGTLESLYSTALKVKTLGTASAPIACTEPVPANQSLITSYTQTTLSWTNLTGNFGGVLHYDVFAGTSPDSLVMVADSIVGTNCTINIIPSKIYYWRVDAINYFGSQQGDLWSFTSGKKPEREKIAYWPLNETTGTTAVNEVYGVATAKGFTPTWSPGKFDNSITFPGAAGSGMVQSHYSAVSLDNKSFTVELWFKSSGGTVDYYLINKGSFVANTATGATGKWFGIQYNKVGSNDRVTWAVDDNVTKTALDIKPGSTYFNNAWTHIVCIRNKETALLQVYINGVLKGSVADKTGDISQIEDIVLGNANVAFTSTYAGQLDEVSIYNSVLTPEEILENYQKGLKTGFANASYNSNVSVYPLPFKNKMNIKSDELEGSTATVRIYCTTGQLVFTSNAVVENNQIQINGLEVLKSGIYVCSLRSVNNKQISFRVIK
ncbi:MAG: T9SS type A sorting domain-containing protein [Paludibacter sp.]|nr:T9SS type A sorting domain-containing protein [Paludibacter sp.]